MTTKIILSAALLSVGLVSAQETITTTTTTTVVKQVQENKETSPTSSLDNHLTIGAPALIFGHLQLSYEHSMSHYLGLGSQFSWTFAPIGDSDRGGSWMLAPFVRLYSHKNRAMGFFGELFMSVGGHNFEIEEGSMFSANKKVTKISEPYFGIGLGLGKKWAIGENLIIELSTGVARDFTKSKHSVDNPPVIGKGMLGLGYRF